MEIVAGALDWTNIDEENLGKFLDTTSGRRLIPRLAELAPQLLGEGETNKLLIRMGEFKGRQDTLRDLLMLSHAQEKPTPALNEYPAPENDAAWNDGQKLNPQE